MKEPVIIIRTGHGDVELGTINQALPELLQMASSCLHQATQDHAKLHEYVQACFMRLTDTAVAEADQNFRAYTAILVFNALAFAQCTMEVACEKAGLEIHMQAQTVKTKDASVN